MENQTKEDLRVIRTKRDLADALETLLQERSLDSLSTKEITDQAMISKNTFYNNFKDKNDLLAFLFNRYFDAMIVQIKPLLDKAYTIAPIKKVYAKKALDQAIEYLFSGNLPLKAMIEHDTNHALFYPAVSFIKKFLDQLMQSYPNLFNKKVEPRLISESLAGAAVSILYHEIEEGEMLSKEKVLKSLLTLMNSLFE